MRFLSSVKKVEEGFLHAFYLSRSYLFVFLVVFFLLIILKNFVFATTPDPGHPWAGVGDGIFAVAGPTVARTFTFPDVDTTVLTSNDTLTVIQGGTGFSSIAQGDLLYGSGPNTYAKLSKDTNATRYLSNTGTSNNPAWAQIDLTNGVTGSLPNTNGGTGNGFLTFSGPATSTKTFTLPDASANILTSNTRVSMAQGGTGANLGAIAGSGFYYPVIYSSAAILLIGAGSSSAGQIVRSGASSAPSSSTATYPSAIGTSGNIIRSNGTNFLNSTASYPDTAGTAGNVVMSDGTNFVSSTLPDQKEFATIGLYAANLTAVTALTSGLSYFQYVGVAPKAYSSCNVVMNVTTQAATITWAEVAIFKGIPPINGNASLTLLGYTDVSGTFNSIGRKSTNVALSGTAQGDWLWVAYGSQATTRFQIRGMLADDIQSGVFQTASVRPSLAASPQSTTIAGATAVPGRISMTCS